MHGSEQWTESTAAGLLSPGLVAVGHPEAGHRVEDLARQLNLGSLSCKGSTSHTSADDRLVSVHGILDQAPVAVA